MGSMQRADRFEKLFKALKKHYKPVTPVSDRKVLDHLLYACCLQDATYEAADESFAKLQQAYFDSNEVRVTTIAELSESLTSLPHAAAAASRIKRSLQSMFESRYSFDIDDLKKSNLGKAVDEISGWQGVSKFVASYVTQHAFGGHSIPVDDSILTVCHLLELLTPAEVDKGTLPGIERAIAKNKGLEFSSLLHQFAVDHAANYKNPIVVAVFKEFGLTSKPKAPPPPPEPPKPAKAAAPTKIDTKPAIKGAKTKAGMLPVAPPPPTTTGSKTKKGELPVAAKPIDSKTAKGAASAKPPVRPTKMAPPPSSLTKSTAKPPVTPAKPAPAVKKTATPIDTKSKSKPATAAKSKAVEKPATKKLTTKKDETKKPTTKKGSAGVPAKPATKRPAASAKPLPKKLPVKPVTKKRTKPR